MTLPAVAATAEVDAGAADSDDDDDLSGPMVDENGCQECGSSDGSRDTLCDACAEVAEDGMPSWSEAGFDKHEAMDWSVAGFDPSEARARSDAGFCI
ncbi:MAG: hypothetical protein WKF57_05915 [Nakamurella sp.]